jgi:hypothetical protein
VQAIVHRGIHNREQSAAWAREFVARELAVDPAALERAGR